MNCYFPNVRAIANQSEFDGFPVAQGEKEENAFSCYLRLSSESGGLIPQSVLAAALNVTRQRVHQLMVDGRFVVHRIAGVNYVTRHSLEAFLKEERKSGGQFKNPSLKQIGKAFIDSFTN